MTETTGIHETDPTTRYNLQATQTMARAERAADVMDLLGMAAWHPEAWEDLDVVSDVLLSLLRVMGPIPPSLDRMLDRVHETRPGEDVASAIARAHLGSILLLASHHASSLVDLLASAAGAARVMPR